MTEYHCRSSTFTERDYLASQQQFWRLPASFGSTKFLTELRIMGGVGALKILPIVGHIAGLNARDDYRLSIEQLARMAGLDPKTCSKARRAFEELEIVRTRTRLFQGERVTHWSVQHSVAAAPDDKAYFRFSMRVVTGRHWAEMTGAQCALYIAAATRAIRSTAPVDGNWLLERVSSDVDLSDIEDCARQTSNPDLRVATLSVAEAAHICGLSARPIQAAIASLRMPRFGIAPPSNEHFYHAPIRAYPVSRGSLIYHFRDHVEPWPLAGRVQYHTRSIVNASVAASAEW